MSDDHANFFDAMASDAGLVLLADVGRAVRVQRLPTVLGDPPIGDATDVALVHVTPAARMGSGMDAAGERTLRPVREKQQWMAMVLAAAADGRPTASGLVKRDNLSDAAGGVVSLRREDRLLVPGHIVGDEAPTVTLRVVGNVVLSPGGGYYTCLLER